VFPIRDLNPTRTTPLVTVALVALNLIVFFAWQPSAFWSPLGEASAAPEFLYHHAAVACEILSQRPLTAAEITGQLCLGAQAPRGAAAEVFPDKQPLTSVVVSMFLHGGIAHILGNMWFLWLFGNNVEEAFGHVRYLVVYLIGGVIATLAFVAAQPGSTVPVVGASGAIAAVLGAYFVLYPGKLVLALAFVSVIPVPAVLFLGLWFVGQFLIAAPGVAWESHAAGFVVGAAVALAFRGPLLARVRGLQRGRAWVDEA
jgi:membrane associated rhomboid family serine protease